MPGIRAARIGSLRIWALGTLTGLALACGGEQETAPSATAPAAEPAPPGAPAKAHDPKELATLEGFYVWDATAGEPRDLKTDVAECLTLRTVPGLGGLREHADCMIARGWKTIAPES